VITLLLLAEELAVLAEAAAAVLVVF